MVTKIIFNIKFHILKKIFILAMLIFSITSCVKDVVLDSTQFPQKWQLIKMTGSKLNYETTGVNMEWQESYLFNSDGTFIKSRERNGKITEALGNYIIKKISDEKYFDLTYQTNYDIIGSCYSNQAESLWIMTERKLIGTWSHCDGPGLEYERVK